MTEMLNIEPDFTAPMVDDRRYYSRRQYLQKRDAGESTNKYRKQAFKANPAWKKCFGGYDWRVFTEVRLKIGEV